MGAGDAVTAHAERIVALILARGGSRRLPGKNVAPLGGRPLIAWTVEAARSAPSVARVIISTDDDAIAEAARAAGAEVPFRRPPVLSDDAATSEDAALHALDWLATEEGEPEWLMLLQPTSPFRTAEDIEGAVAVSRSHADVDAVVAVSELVPATWLVRLTEGDRLERWDPAASPEMLYRPNGSIYLVRTAALRREGTFRPAATCGYLMPARRSLDIDMPFDLELAHALLDSASEGN